MASGPGIQYKFGQVGIEDLTGKIRDLHQQFAAGQIVYKEYHSGIKEATEQGRAATSEFNQMKGAIAAANPQLLEFSRTMSMFGGIANTVLSITNAINLAQLAGAGISSELAQTQSQAAAAYNEYIKDLNAYGPADSRTVSAWNQYQALLKQVQYEQQQLARESISTAATLIASGFAIAGSISQTVIGFKALNEMMSPQLAENFAIGLLAAGQAMLYIGGPIALVIGGIEAIYQLIKLLDPAFAESASNLENSIMSNWHVSSIEAALLAPFVGFAGGVVDIANHVHAVLVNLYNAIVIDVLDPLIDAWDSTVGKIAGHIDQIQAQFYHIPTKDEILSSFGLGSSSSSSVTSGGTGNPHADAINQMLVGTPTSSTSVLNNLQQAATFTGTIASSQQLANQYLNSLLANSQSGNQLAQQQLQALQQQKEAQQAVKDALAQGLGNSTAKLSDLQAQLDKANQDLKNAGASHADMLANSPNVTASDFPDIMNALANVNSIQSQIDSTKASISDMQQKQTSLDNMTSGLEPVLASIGLSSDTGIGSIIAGALGGYGGVGGAGITDAELKHFAETGDYGVFTHAAINDSLPNGSSGGHGNGPTDQQQIDSLAASLAKNLGVDLTSHPYLIDEAKKTLINGHVIKAATGFDGTVSSPTHFLAGESGPETVSITPLSKSGRTGGISLSVIVQGTLQTENNLHDTILRVLKEALKQGGF